MIRARLGLSVSNVRISKSLVQAVAPDNRKLAGLEISGRANPRSVVFNLTYEGRVETFIFTLDDLLRCLQAARETLDTIHRKKLE